MAPRADDDPEVERVRAIVEARLLGTGRALARLTAPDVARLLRDLADEAAFARRTGGGERADDAEEDGEQ